MQDPKRSVLPSKKLLLVAALAGSLAGGVAVYMKEAGPGNGQTASGDEIDCNPAVAQASTLKPLSKGEIAAFMPATKPVLLDLSFKGPDGKDMRLVDGKTIRLVNLWATWCVPCREEMPALDRLEQNLGGPDFEVVAVNIDTGDDTKPKAFLDEIKVAHLDYYRDATMGTFAAMKKQGLAFGLPVTALIDRKGCLLGAMNGPAKWDSEDAAAMLKAAIGSRPAS